MYPSGSAPGSVGTLFGNHTRSSSFYDKPPKSYVPMAPQSVASSVTSRDEEGGSYMDMQYRRSVPREAHHLRGRPGPASGSLLASSFNTGTPPVGRFKEYHLEKVSSFLTPSEDDDSLSPLNCNKTIESLFSWFQTGNQRSENGDRKSRPGAYCCARCSTTVSMYRLIHNHCPYSFSQSGRQGEDLLSGKSSDAWK